MALREQGKIITASVSILVLLCAFTSAAFADIFTWSDGDGVHYTDNLGSVPEKYRKQAQSEAGNGQPATAPMEIDLKEHPELIISSTPQKERQHGPKKAKQFRRGQRLGASESIGIDKKDGCYLSYSVQPGPGYQWNPNSYSVGAMKMNVSTEADCLQDCNDNAQQQSLSAAKGWRVLGSCYYNGQTLSSDIRF